MSFPFSVSFTFSIFFTFFILYIALDARTGQIECIDAGHPPAMVIEQQGQVRKLQFAQNPPLGCERFDFQVETSRIEPGELLALFTDGLTESRNGANQMLGIDGVGEMLCTLWRESSDADAAAMTDRLTQQLNAYEGNVLRADDRTFLLARRINS